MSCRICNKTFSKFSKYKAHVKTFHPDDFNQLPPYKPKENAVAKCAKCQKEFMRKYNLKVHMERFHDVVIEKKIYNYKCDMCTKQFSHLRHLKYHQKSHSMQSDTNKLLLKCPICHNEFKKQTVFLHFEEKHNINLEIAVLQFPSAEEFNAWKVETEKNTKSSFVKPYTSYSTQDAKMTKYICHRSGNFTSKSKGTRHLKTQGSNKINGFCPAGLKVTEKNGVCDVLYTKTHVGHDNDVEHLHLMESERAKLAAKIAAQVPLDSILDEIRDSANGELQRLHLLTKKDLYNIKQCFKLNSTSVQHKNEAVSVKDWVNELRNYGCVLFYKPKDAVCSKYPSLKEEDFVLIIMNEEQKEMLQRYGSDCICLDGTHELNAYGFELNTLLVLDQMREGFPCSFLISNRSDETVMRIYFSHINEKLEIQIKPKVFMSDMDETFYKAWQQVMLPADFRLFCTWHVDRAWRENLEKIDSKEMQVAVYQKLRGLLQERDLATFKCMIRSFVTSMSLNPVTYEFAAYFQQSCLPTIAAWANCYRLHNGLNTKMNFERMHKTIKYLYLHGKHNKRLDTAINAIIKFVRDKLFNQLIIQNKGKLCAKIKDLQQRHKASEKLDLNEIKATKMTWEVPSLTSNDIYVVEERINNCDCKLICPDCNACLHHYSCSCLDSAIKWNMCKHIHLVCRYQKSLQTPSQTVELLKSQPSDNEKNLIIVETSIASKVIESVSMKRKKIDNDLQKKLQDFKDAIMLQLDDIKTIEELEAVKKTCEPIQPTLYAIRNFKSVAQNKSISIP